jgi:hypothetical protein
MMKSQTGWLREKEQIHHLLTWIRMSMSQVSMRQICTLKRLRVSWTRWRIRSSMER